MSFFDLPPIIERMLLVSDKISDLNFSVGQLPQVDINVKLTTAQQLGLQKLTPYLRNGLVLLTGPTGSGKSSTLAAIIDIINESKHYHVVAIEDPIEYLHTHKNSTINQREVGHDTKDFPSALRAALRQAPKVI